MILLRTLGSCDLSAPDRPNAAAVLAQPKRFALLVYLAIATPRGFVRRDTLLALFWPETDQVRGRQVLRQTVYLLRQSLGADAIASRGEEEVAISPDALHSDVGLFEDALASGRAADALERYRGDFLAGLHVPEASQALEEWIEGERRRLRALATGGAWTLAMQEEQAGNGAGAAHWARRAVALDPDGEHGVRDLMQLLARVGDRSGALRAYDEYTRRVTEQLNAEPGPEVRHLAESLRRAPSAAAGGPSVAAIEGPVATPSASPSQPRRRLVLLGAAAALALVVVAAGVSRLARGSRAPPVIAVGPITDALAGTGAVSNVPADLLSTSLARLVGVHVIPVTRLYDLEAQLRAVGRPGTSVIEAARQAGAGELIQGTLHRGAEGRLQLDLQVVNLANGAVERAYRAEGADLFAVVDDATARIALGFGVASPQGRITDVTTQSVVAYRLYDEGLRAYYLEDVVGATRLFAAALAEDSSFAMAAYYAGLSALAARQGAEPYLLRAARLADRATDRERLLILEGVAEIQMSPAANALADTLVDRYPLDPDAQFAVGHSLERRGEFLAAARQYRRVIAMDSLSPRRRSSRCLACDAYQRLWWSYIYADSAAAAERVAREMGRVQPGSGFAAWLLGTALARQGREREAYQVWESADSVRGGSASLELGAAQLAIRRGGFVEADEILRRLMRSGSQPLRADASWLLVISLRAQGRLVEAVGVAHGHPRFPAAEIALLEAGRGREAAVLFERQLRRPPSPEFPGHRARHHAWHGTHLATCLAAVRDTTRLAALADSVEYHGSRSGFGRDPRLHFYIRGLLWKARGDLARAAEAFRASVWSWSDGYTRANYELARTLLELRRPADALYPLQAALRGDLASSNLYATRTELH